ncbi:MAG: hypothetical protein RL011_1640 [Pseudomonadota bacterium]
MLRVAARSLVASALLWLTPMPAALGCASCGSGGDDPLILYPNERDKTFLALGRTTGFRNINGSGGLATAGGPLEREALTFAYGHSFSLRSFATVTVPTFRNVGAQDSVSGVGDPLIATRYTLLMPDLTEPSVPQVQLIAGFKQSHARSVHNSEDTKELLDVFGTGFSDARAGVDLWFGQFAPKFGLAQTFAQPLPRTYDGVEYRPGLVARSTVTTGYQWSSATKTLVGANREQSLGLTVGGMTAPNSAQLNHSVFLTQDYYPSMSQLVRLTVSQQAAFGPNKNTARSSTFTVVYQHTIRS